MQFAPKITAGGFPHRRPIDSDLIKPPQKTVYRSLPAQVYCRWTGKLGRRNAGAVSRLAFGPKPRARQFCRQANRALGPDGAASKPADNSK